MTDTDYDYILYDIELCEIIEFEINVSANSDE